MCVHAVCLFCAGGRACLVLVVVSAAAAAALGVFAFAY